jgi:hypothetical protein
LVLNGSYGAFAASYFILHNPHVAASITAQGRDLTKTMNRVNEEYWYEQWHLDKELHNKVCIKNIRQIFKSGNNKEEVSIYADTDSCHAYTLTTLLDKDGREKTITFEEWYNENTYNGSAGETIKGHESVKTSDRILNWSEDKEIYYAPVKRIIRHKVSKQKWFLKTKSGKEIIVTNDHSMIVFRDGNKIEVKPSEVLNTDKILIIKKL